MDNLITILIILFTFVVVPVLIGYIVGILLAIPFALFNKLRGRKFTVSRKLRYTLQGIGVILVIALILTGLPGYDDYTDRAQASEGLSLTSALKTPLAEYHKKNGTFVGVTVDKFLDTTRGKYVDNIRFDHISDNTIAVIATFRMTGIRSSIKGLELRNVTVDGGKTWSCGAAIKNPVLRGTHQIPVKAMVGACR